MKRKKKHRPWKWRSEPINLTRNKWAYRDKNSITLVESDGKGAGWQIKVTASQLQKILRAKP